ncbi:response regulator [Bradyrhizobium sp. SZCCHNRI3052]|uniref:response regulator n=1 Tax=Bradyrhizobium sp. SZCCHNRI3052 TaxID=3057295 RepID=UPI00291683FE|nr:response regulator [Bradyrhizobium sp. SZCCHNRI3052]
MLTSEKPLGVAEQMRRAAKASNADEAIAILETRPDIHVVFTDIQMAGSMDGLKLAHFVRGRWPPIKIIATSGHHAFKEADYRREADFCLSLMALTASPRYSGS